MSQMQDGVERVLAYYSCSLDQAEKNYYVTRKELLAAVKAIRDFILICWEDHSFFVLIMRHYDGLSISNLQKAREPGGFSICIIKSNTNKELNTTMLIHSQEGLVPETYNICRHDRLDQNEEHLRGPGKEAGLYVCCATCIDAISGRWS